MALTDVQIYESHPEVKALNDEYVSLGKSLPDLANKTSSAGAALADAENVQRDAIRTATEAVQAAQKMLAKVTADQRVAVLAAKRAYSEATSEQVRVQTRRAEVQRLHNEAVDAIQAAHLEETPAPAQE